MVLLWGAVFLPRISPLLEIQIHKTDEADFTDRCRHGGLG